MNSLSRTHFAAWMTAYGRASTENDLQASATLFAPDARYYENPFDAPIIGRAAIYDYWRQGAETLRDKESTFNIMAVQANRGIARWQSFFTVIVSGERLALDCLFVVTFDDDGLCQIFQEWWHMQQVALPANSLCHKGEFSCPSKK